MATRNRFWIEQVRQNEAPPTGEGQDTSKIIKFLPLGTTAEQAAAILGTLYSSYGLDPYDGPQSALSTSCITVAPPVAGAPVWNALPTQPGMYPGLYYEYVIPYSAVTAGDGTPRATITMDDHPFLRYTYTEAGVKIYGTIPDDINHLVEITLRATQNDSKSTPEIVQFNPVLVSTIPIVAMWRNYNLGGGNTNLVLRIGGDWGNNLPKVFINGPVGFSANGTGDISMPPARYPDTDTVYFYNSPGNANAPAGNYYARFDTPSGIRYASFTLTSGGDSVDRPLSLGLTPTTQPGTPDPVVVAPVAIDYAYTESTRALDIWIKTNGGTLGKLEWSYEILAPGDLETGVPGGSPPSVAYMALTETDYGNGYTLHGIKSAFPYDPDYRVQFNLYVRRIGTTTPVIVYYLETTLSGVIARHKVWPAPGTNFTDHFIAT